MESLFTFLIKEKISTDTVRGLINRALTLKGDTTTPVSIQESIVARFINENISNMAGVFRIEEEYGTPDFESGDFGDPVYVGSPVSVYSLSLRFPEKLDGFSIQFTKDSQEEDVVKGFVDKYPDTRWCCLECGAFLYVLDSREKIKMWMEKFKDGDLEKCTRPRCKKKGVYNSFSISRDLEFLRSIIKK